MPVKRRQQTAEDRKFVNTFDRLVRVKMASGMNRRRAVAQVSREEPIIAANFVAATQR